MTYLDICFQSATSLLRLIREKAVSSKEVVEAHLAQIEKVNPTVNAVVTLTAERALEEADLADKVLAEEGRQLGSLHGLPVVHKDDHLTEGIRTTFGSKAFQDFVPDRDELIVERFRKAGAITLGKTNLPELGARPQTFNALFGKTHNPYDITKTCAGSSGGSAVALACGMAPLADGGDMGGSIRIPASFCNVVGLRPSPGRVPRWPSPTAWFTLPVSGPMTRTVEDTALALNALAGPDVRSPIAIAEGGEIFSRSLQRDFAGVRIAWSRDLGELPVDPRVTDVLDGQRHQFEAIGCTVEDAEPDFTGAGRIYEILRQWFFELGVGELLDTHAGEIDEDFAWSLREGRRLSGPQLGWAERERTELYHRVRTFMEGFEYLVLPVAQVTPFDIDQRSVPEINGVRLEKYFDWNKTCQYITLTGLPAISVPCGFTPEGLPVGIQIVGRHQEDFGVLQLAYAFEQATGFWRRRPPLVNDVNGLGADADLSTHKGK